MASRIDSSFCNVTVSEEGREAVKNATVKLNNTQVESYVNASLVSAINVSTITAIEVHQPIFGTNYIDVEHGGRRTVLTFNGGGATEFAREFFRIREGRLETPQQQPNPPQNRNNIAELNKKKTE